MRIFLLDLLCAIGNEDPRCTNQTLENTFETKNIKLEYVFGNFSLLNKAAF
jgi:hypothetical protein